MATDKWCPSNVEIASVPRLWIESCSIATQYWRLAQCLNRFWPGEKEVFQEFVLSFSPIYRLFCRGHKKKENYDRSKLHPLCWGLQWCLLILTRYRQLLVHMKTMGITWIIWRNRWENISFISFCGAILCCIDAIIHGPDHKKQWSTINQAMGMAGQCLGLRLIQHNVSAISQLMNPHNTLS